MPESHPSLPTSSQTTEDLVFDCSQSDAEVQRDITAACKVLKGARIVLLACPAAPAPSSSFSLAKSFDRCGLLDLPSVIVHTVFSFLSLGALSDRQVGSVPRHAADWTTLKQVNIELEPTRLNWRQQRALMLKTLKCYEHDFGR